MRVMSYVRIVAVMRFDAWLKAWLCSRQPMHAMRILKYTIRSSNYSSYQYNWMLPCVPIPLGQIHICLTCCVGAPKLFSYPPVFVLQLSLSFSAFAFLLSLGVPIYFFYIFSLLFTSCPWFNLFFFQTQCPVFVTKQRFDLNSPFVSKLSSLFHLCVRSHFCDHVGTST